MATTVHTDVLRTEFQVVNQDQANRAVDAHYAKLQTTSTQITALGKKTTDELLNQRAQFEQALNRSLIQSHNLTANLNRTGGGAFRAAIAEAETLRARINQIATTSVKAKAFDSLKLEAGIVQSKLDDLEAKIARVQAGRSAGAAAAAGSGLSRQNAASRLNLARQGADVFTQLGSGQDVSLIAIQQGPQILDAMATSGITLSRSLLVSVGAIGAIAAAGYAIVKITQSIREEAERRLKVEEAIQGAINRQILSGKELLDNFQKQRQAQADQREFSKDLAKGDVESLKRQRATLEQLIGNNRDGKGPGLNAEENIKKVLEIDARLAQLQDKASADADAAFEQRWQNWKAAQEAAKKAEEEFAESVAKGKEKLDEIGKSAKDLFADLYAAQGAQNPFVQVFDEADKAVERTRLTTSLLSDELKAVAENMTAAANANALFSARLDAKLTASDLRADAQRFRNFESFRSVDDIAAQLARESAGGFFRNEQAFLSLQGSGRRSDLFAFQRQREQSEGLFRNPAADEAIRRSLLDQDAINNPTARERFDRQLSVIRDLRPENDAQRAEAERKIIELGRGLDPGDISAEGRDAIAQALENQAVRTENAEKEAKAQRDAQMKTQESIDANIKELLDIAKKEGLTGVIRIINEAEDRAKVSLGKRPTESDVAGRTEL